MSDAHSGQRLTRHRFFTLGQVEFDGVGLFAKLANEADLTLQSVDFQTGVRLFVGGGHLGTMAAAKNNLHDLLFSKV